MHGSRGDTCPFHPIGLKWGNLSVYLRAVERLIVTLRQIIQ
jgi:hypothetical protein